MRKENLLALFTLPLLMACSTNNNEQPTPNKPDAPEIKINYADIFVYMGQSNMAGRGEAADSIPCIAGHGYEYLSVTGTEGNYFKEMTEPFGKFENNDAMKDGETGDGKKTGDLVAAFAEGFYEERGYPVIGISASVGNTSITKWTPNTTYFNEIQRRIINCVDKIKEEKIFEISTINMVWCQGSNDASSYVGGTLDYFQKLQSIFDGLHALEGDYSVDNCFIIPCSTYSSSAINENKKKLADDQIAYCDNHDNFIAATNKFSNVPLSMRDDPHFHQGVYNVAGYDAGKRCGHYLKTGEKTALTEFEIGEDVSLAERYGVNLTYKSI